MFDLPLWCHCEFGFSQSGAKSCFNPGNLRRLRGVHTSEASQILANINAMPLVPPPEDMPVLHTGVTNAVFHLLYRLTLPIIAL